MASVVDADGQLLMRPVTVDDRDALAEFNALVHAMSPDVPDLQAATWTRDLLRGDHPTSPIADHLLIEDQTNGQIVSSCLLISQTWTYEGIAFEVGRPEMIGTHPDYRGRGLVGAQMKLLHQRSRERGQLVQAITGIPNYYRQFGYEPALLMAPGQVASARIPVEPPSSRSEEYRFRATTSDDVPLIAELYRRSTERSAIAAIRDETIWTYELTRDPSSDHIHDLLVIESASGAQIGVVAHQNRFRGGTLSSPLVELLDPTMWPALTDEVFRFLLRRGQELAETRGEPFRTISLDLVPEHPLVQLASSRLSASRRPFAWEVRVADVPAFLRLIAPALERRLGASILAGFSGQLGLSFYRSGVRLQFDRGAIASIEPWLPEVVWRADATFPGASFLSLLFGSRSVDQLQEAYPDCRIATDLARVLLTSLFPVRPSVIWPIG